VNGIVDAHMHVWDARRAEHPWLPETDLAPVFSPADARAELDAIGVEQLVLVQAADNLDDTQLMLDTARTEPRVAGVVAWAPLRDPGAVASLADEWAGQPVVGVRHMIHRDPDPDFLLDEQVLASLALLGERGLAFDICAESLHLLSLIPEVSARVPGTQFVLDHLGKPPIRDEGWSPWAELFADAARCPNVVVKLSGLNTAAAPGWSSSHFTRYVDHALHCFGPQRMMYGGDWPFALLAAESYTQVWEGLRPTLDDLSESEREQVLAETARRIYRLPSA